MLKTEMRNTATTHIDREDGAGIAKLIQAENVKAALAVGECVEEVGRAIDAAYERMARGGRMIYFGCGTSGRLGVMDAAEIPPTYHVKDKVIGVIAGGDGCLRTANEKIEDYHANGIADAEQFNLTANDVVVGISVAGGAEYVLGAMEVGKKAGVLLIGLTSNAGSKIDLTADIGIHPDTGAEPITGSTRMKAGSAHKMVLNMLSTGVMIRLGRVFQNLMIDVQPGNAKLKKRVVYFAQDVLGVSAEEAERRLEENGWDLRKVIGDLRKGNDVSEFYLGIDGGGTKTEFLLVDADGNEVRRVLLGGSNPADVGVDGTVAVLREGIVSVCGDVPRGNVRMFAGISGGTPFRLNELLPPKLADLGLVSVAFGSDAENAVAAGLRGKDGVAVILGTGIIAFSVCDGVRHRVAGLGHLYDAGGSGYNLGHDALYAAACAEDGLGPATLLRELVAEKLGTQHIFSVWSDVIAFGKRRTAAFCSLVFEAACRGDAVAADILARNMREAARIVNAAASRFPIGTVVDAVFVGGLTCEADVLFPLITQHLDPSRQITLRRCVGSPVEGAVLFAGLKNG